jgi:large subunit ribosomal protein L30
MPNTNTDKTLRITMTKSPITAKWPQKRTLQALGLRKMHQTVEKPDNPSIRGMIHHVVHLVTVEEVEK